MPIVIKIFLKLLTQSCQLGKGTVEYHSVLDYCWNLSYHRIVIIVCEYGW